MCGGKAEECALGNNGNADEVCSRAVVALLLGDCGLVVRSWREKR